VEFCAYSNIYVPNIYDFKFCNKNAEIQGEQLHMFNSFVNKFGNDVFSTDSTVLFCQICEMKVAADKKFTIKQHISRIKHIN